MAFISRALWKGCSTQICRSFHVSHISRKHEYGEFMFKMSGYYKYGLLHDDLIGDLHPDVIEAIRRMPEEEQMQRIYRAIRAAQAEINHSILPKEQWSKFEDNHFYLQPYLDEVSKEKEEIMEWEANH